MSPEKKPERIKIKDTREIPRGEDLLRRTFDIAFNSLTSAYPILLRDDYASRLPSFERIHIEPLNKVAEREKVNKPNEDIVLFLALKLAGVPVEHLEKMRFSISRESLLYIDNTQSETDLYIPQEVMDNLSSSEMEIRARESVYLVHSLMLESIARAPIPRKLEPNIEWREIVKAQLPKFLQILETNSGTIINPQDMDKIERMLDELIDIDCSVVAKGSQIMLLLPRQTVHNPELTLGNDFNEGTMLFLIRKARISTMQKMGSMLGITRPFKMRLTNAQTLAESVLQNMQWYGKPIDKNQLMEDYLDSYIPTLYHSSGTGTRNNPWIYPR